MVDGGDNVLGGQRLAIVELRPLAQPEDPRLGIFRGLETLGGIAGHLAVGLDLGQARAQGSPAEQAVEGVGPGGRVEGVGRGAAADADPEGAALLGLGFRLGEKERIGGGDGEACRKGQLMEIATRDLSLPGKQAGGGQLVFLFGHRILPVVVVLSFHEFFNATCLSCSVFDSSEPAP